MTTDPKIVNPSVDDGVTAASASPAAVRSDEGPGISDTDSPEERARAGDAGQEAFQPRDEA